MSLLHLPHKWNLVFFQVNLSFLIQKRTSDKMGHYQLSHTSAVITNICLTFFSTVVISAPHEMV